jgi:hypothetical protein
MAEATHELVLGCDATMQLDRHFLQYALAWFASDKVAAVFGWINEGAKPTPANRCLRDTCFSPNSHRNGLLRGGAP